MLKDPSTYTFFIQDGEIPFSENVQYDCCAGGSKIERRYYYPDSIVSFSYQLGQGRGYLDVKEGHVLLYRKRLMTKDSMMEYYYHHQVLITDSLQYDYRNIESSSQELEILDWKKYVFEGGFMSNSVSYQSKSDEQQRS